MEFNVDLALKNYEKFGFLLRSGGKEFYIASDFIEKNNLDILENVVIIDAIKKSNMFKRHKIMYLTPALDDCRIKSLINKNANSLEALLNGINEACKQNCNHVKSQNFVEFISSIYPNEIPGVVSEICKSEAHFNTLVSIAKKRSSGVANQRINGVIKKPICAK